MSAEEYWKMRAAGYNKLSWATSNEYARHFLDAGHFAKDQRVLDAGCGTGIITKLIAPHVKEIIGIDISEDMLKPAQAGRLPNESYQVADMRAMPFPDNSFDRVTARMVLHHLMKDLQKGVDECYRVLKPGGILIVSEGIPPDPAIEDWYTEMFRHKEERLTFSEASLVGTLERAGFCDIYVDRFIMRAVSIGNWLSSSGIPQAQQDLIMQMHRSMPTIGHALYNAVFRDDDVLLDMHFLVLLGKKAS